MYVWYVVLDLQAPNEDLCEVSAKIRAWGAKRNTATPTNNGLQIAYESRKNPTKMLNELKGQGVLLQYEILNRTQTSKPRRKKVDKPKNKEAGFRGVLRRLQTRRLVP